MHTHPKYNITDRERLIFEDIRAMIGPEYICDPNEVEDFLKSKGQAKVTFARPLYPADKAFGIDRYLIDTDTVLILSRSTYRRETYGKKTISFYLFTIEDTHDNCIVIEVERNKSNRFPVIEAKLNLWDDTKSTLEESLPIRKVGMKMSVLCYIDRNFVYHCKTGKNLKKVRMTQYLIAAALSVLAAASIVFA